MGRENKTQELVATMIIWDDLTKEEQTTLQRMNRRLYRALPRAIGERLVSLGLATERLDGIGISRAGRELVISILLGVNGDHH